MTATRTTETLITPPPARLPWGVLAAADSLSSPPSRSSRGCSLPAHRSSRAHHAQLGRRDAVATGVRCASGQRTFVRANIDPGQRMPCSVRRVLDCALRRRPHRPTPGTSCSAGTALPYAQWRNPTNRLSGPGPQQSRLAWGSAERTPRRSPHKLHRAYAPAAAARPRNANSAPRTPGQDHTRNVATCDADSDRASRASLVTTNVSQARQAAGPVEDRSVAVSVGLIVIDVDPIITDAERVQAIALGGETLLIC